MAFIKSRKAFRQGRVPKTSSIDARYDVDCLQRFLRFKKEKRYKEN
jgi:hypothetical protein